MAEIILTKDIVHNDYTNITNAYFDVPITDKITTVIKDNLELPSEWQIGVVCGASGSGKSTILKKHFGEPFSFKWNNESIISNFKHITPTEASEMLCAVGLSSVPTWLVPYENLSNGEKFRADMAMALSKSNFIVIDEYTSVVDRNVALAMSNSIQKYVRKHNKKIVLASCHFDILKTLKPDWVYNPTDGETLYNVVKYADVNKFSMDSLKLGGTVGEIVIE